MVMFKTSLVGKSELLRQRVERGLGVVVIVLEMSFFPFMQGYGRKTIF